MSIKAMKATPHKQLIDELMDCRIPKTEREHAAAREIERLRQAIAEAEKQEPVASCVIRTLVSIGEDGIETFYTSQLQRTWVGLTDEEIAAWNIVGNESLRVVQAIEAKLKEKNT